MALSKSKYADIMYEYDERVSRNKRIREKRKNEVNEKIPGFKELDEAIPRLSLQYGLGLVRGESDLVYDLDKKAREIRLKKKELLKEYGYSEDYLDPIYDCPDCKDTGYIGNERCHCLKQAIINTLYDQSNIADIIREENFKTLSYDYYYDNELEQMEKIIDFCKAFVQSFEREDANRNILFFGDPGTGKTFLTNCIAKELLDKGHSVIYFTSTTLFDTLATYSFRNYEDSDDMKGIRDDIFNCDLLVIDDLGTETVNSFVVSRFFLIINERLNRRRGTIISTNLSMSDLSERYESRSASRLLGSYALLNPKIADIRIKKKKINKI
ncbi:MAG: ATP-binding protein [Lachnospiraceae bacterium]|nr:ATP-binding protein [Lachnospiraceae bacterium]